MAHYWKRKKAGSLQIFLYRLFADLNCIKRESNVQPNSLEAETKNETRRKPHWEKLVSLQQNGLDVSKG